MSFTTNLAFTRISLPEFLSYAAVVRTEDIIAQGTFNAMIKEIENACFVEHKRSRVLSRVQRGKLRKSLLLKYSFFFL